MLQQNTTETKERYAVSWKETRKIMRWKRGNTNNSNTR